MPPADPPPDAPELPEDPASPRRRPAETDEGRPLAELPRIDFWDALYRRRSIRRFLPDPVPRELIDQVLHAGIWAPSSCNYQMWDVVAVDDPALNGRLTELSTQLGNAPVNLVVSYGRDFSEEGWANIQSASAMIQNMSLAAHALGLGTFWITQLGDREELRELVGLPRDRLVIAALALGYPKTIPSSGPKRRALSQVTHYNHYAGEPIPSSVDPADWSPELLAVYQRARVLNGLRHNKPRPWEVRALEACLERFVPEGRTAPTGGGEPVGRWLDVLPCTGLWTEKLSRERPGWRFDVVERTPEVADFAARRTRPPAGVFAWPNPRREEAWVTPPAEAYDLVSCLFRLEGLAPGDRPDLAVDMMRWLKPGGRLLIGYVSRSSFHRATEAIRRRSSGPGGVEYVLAPDPNIGPFQALAPRELERLLTEVGLIIEDRLGLQAVPQPEELAFRTRNFSRHSRALAGLAAGAFGWIAKLPGLESRRGRFRFLVARKPG